MQAVLVMFRSDGDRRSFSITRDITVIGRREDCDLRIPLGDVSRKHCRIVRDGDSLRLEDLGSSNGTYHNGQRIQETNLSPGDSLQVGPVVFVLQMDGVPEDDELQPVMAASAGAAAGGLAAEDELAAHADLDDEHTAAGLNANELNFEDSDQGGLAAKKTESHHAGEGEEELNLDDLPLADLDGSGFEIPLDEADQSKGGGVHLDADEKK